VVDTGEEGVEVENTTQKEAALLPLQLMARMMMNQ
jgi:hypothetical protein